MQISVQSYGKICILSFFTEGQGEKMIKKSKLAMGLAGLLALSSMGCDILGSDSHEDEKSSNSWVTLSSSSNGQSSSSFDFNWQQNKSSSSQVVEPIFLENSFRGAETCMAFSKENCRKVTVAQDPCGWAECPTHEEIQCRGITYQHTVFTRGRSSIINPGDTVIVKETDPNYETYVSVNESDTTISLTKACAGRKSGDWSDVYFQIGDVGYCRLKCLDESLKPDNFILDEVNKKQYSIEPFYLAEY